MIHVPLPFDGKRTTWENGHGTGGTYPLDTSGRRGAPLAWACRTPEHAATLARIFAGDLDASPARRHFAEGIEPVPWRACESCGVRPVRAGRRCEACARRDQRAARARPSLTVLWDGDADADGAALCSDCGERPPRAGCRKCRRCSDCADQRRREEERAEAPVGVSPEVARRVALRERRKALAAWMAGEGSTPPGLAARLREVGA